MHPAPGSNSQGLFRETSCINPAPILIRYRPSSPAAMTEATGLHSTTAIPALRPVCVLHTSSTVTQLDKSRGVVVSGRFCW